MTRFGNGAEKLTSARWRGVQQPSPWLVNKMLVNGHSHDSEGDQALTVTVTGPTAGHDQEPPGHAREVPSAHVAYTPGSAKDSS